MPSIATNEYRSCMRLPLKRLAVAAGFAWAAAVSGACRITSPHTCFEIEYADCPSVPGDRPDSVRVIGFRRDHVDSLEQGHLHIGESVTLALLILVNAQHYPGDTSRTATWSVPAGTTAVRLEDAGNGTVRLTASAAGTVDAMVVDGAARPVWSYSTISAIRLTRIIVDP